MQAPRDEFMLDIERLEERRLPTLLSAAGRSVKPDCWFSWLWEDDIWATPDLE